MKGVIMVILCVLAVGYVGACGWLYSQQRSLTYYPQPRAVTAPESTLRLPVNGAEVVVTVRPLDGSKAIVYFGGNGEDVSGNLDGYSKAFPDQALYFMHYRGYGGSTGEPTEKDNIADAHRLYDRVRAKHADVTIIGRSLGTGVAIQLASRVDATRLILITPYDSLVEIGAQMYPWMPVRFLMLDKYESGKFAASIHIPTTVIEAEDDEEIPHSSTEKLLARFSPGIARMTLIEGVGHNNLGENPKYLQTLQAALR